MINFVGLVYDSCAVLVDFDLLPPGSVISLGGNIMNWELRHFEYGVLLVTFQHCKTTCKDVGWLMI
jgi:hypothetical protein